ncbi:hypothetical protein [Ohtaekwangia sp.]|uniref:hypothetical protein n=1 Tax=Ohtaekwangia sp. TaxID=2066019 RepID=UPI002F94BA1D
MQVRFLILIALVTGLHTSFAQTYFREENWIDELNLAGGLPEKLLSTRTAVFYDYTLTEKDLNTMQEYFQRSGIDAVAYHELDMLMAGKDVTRGFSDFLEKREITNLVFLEKKESGYRIVITTFNGKDNVVDPKQNAWSASHTILTELLKNVYRTTSGQKKLNLLINDVPETGLTVNPILGKRNEFFAIDLKVDPLAVPKFGNEEMDKKLEAIFKENYPLKYKLTEPGLTEKELRKQGSLYVLCIVHTRGAAIKELYGYPMTKSESALVSVTYPEAQQQLKNIPSNTPVYKVYFKHIDSGNVFLGTKWDSDITWEQALINHIKGLKAELKLN